jgi:hypothetical protein
MRVYDYDLLIILIKWVLNFSVSSWFLPKILKSKTSLDDILHLELWTTATTLPLFKRYQDSIFLLSVLGLYPKAFDKIETVLFIVVLQNVGFARPRISLFIDLF